MAPRLTRRTCTTSRHCLAEVSPPSRNHLNLRSTVSSALLTKRASPEAPTTTRVRRRMRARGLPSPPRREGRSESDRQHSPRVLWEGAEHLLRDLAAVEAHSDSHLDLSRRSVRMEPPNSCRGEGTHRHREPDRDTRPLSRRERAKVLVIEARCGGRCVVGHVVNNAAAAGTNQRPRPRAANLSGVRRIRARRTNTSLSTLRRPAHPRPKKPRMRSSRSRSVDSLRRFVASASRPSFTA